MPCVETKMLSLAEEFARENPSLSDRQGASGRCLWSSLQFAVRAQEAGINVDLIRWQVREDEYCDHWAIVTDKKSVIDLTHAQVDGRSGLVWRVREYPRNYLSPRRYPAVLLLTEYSRRGRIASDYVDVILGGYDGRRLLFSVHCSVFAVFIVFLAWKFLSM